MVEVFLVVVQLLLGFNGCSLMREAKIFTSPASSLPLPVPTKSGAEDGWKSKGKCAWCVISGRDLPASPTQLRVQSGCVDPRSDSAPVQRFPSNFLPKPRLAGAACKEIVCFSWILHTATSGSLRCKARGPQDVQDADKINTGELSVSLPSASVYFCSWFHWTQDKRTSSSPFFLSSSPKLPKLECYMLNRRQQRDATRKMRGDGNSSGKNFLLGFSFLFFLTHKWSPWELEQVSKSGCKWLHLIYLWRSLK